MYNSNSGSLSIDQKLHQRFIFGTDIGQVTYESEIIKTDRFYAYG